MIAHNETVAKFAKLHRLLSRKIWFNNRNKQRRILHILSH